MTLSARERAKRIVRIYCDNDDFQGIVAEIEEAVEEAKQSCECLHKDDKRYPCAECGKLRTKAEGGTVFTVCDDCWQKDENLYKSVCE